MRNVVLRLISIGTAHTAFWVFYFFFQVNQLWFLFSFILFQSLLLPCKSNGVFSFRNVLLIEALEILKIVGSLSAFFFIARSLEMASSQVEIASNSPFGYVLKERNRHDHRCRTRDSNAFKKNFKDLVQTHLNSCISGHSRNSGSGFIDYTDLWVHNPQNVNNENNFHSQNSGDATMSGHSDSNQNSNRHIIDSTNLWVHNPQRNNNDNNATKKNKASEKWDKARVKVFGFEKKMQESSSSSGSVKNQDNNASSVPVSNSQRGDRLKEGAPSGPASTSNRERSPDGSASASGPVSSTSQKRKSQEGMASGPDSRSQRENSPVQSESSSEVPSSRGVSSLVQKWRDFEAEAKSSLSATNSPVFTSRSNSVLFLTDNESFVDALTGRASDASEEFVDLRPATPTKSEELFLDWESDQTGLSGPPSATGRDSDAAERETIRVADIIKKLTSNGEKYNDREPSVSHEWLPRVRTSVDKSELRSFSPVSSSPRVRGRQAFVDLLMQMEGDRQKELEGLAHSKAVSRFSHRGRIQAMLRVRFLRRGAEGKDGRQTISAASDSSRLAQSAILHIRQRFNEGVRHNETDSRSQQGEEEMVDKAPHGKKFSVISQQTKENHQRELTEPTKPPLIVLDNNLDAQNAIRMNAVLDFNHQEPDTTVQQNDLQQQGSQIFHQEDNSSSDVTHQWTKSECCNHKKPELTVEETSAKKSLGTEHSVLEESKNQKLIGSSNESVNVIAEAQGDDMEDEDAHQNLAVSDFTLETDVSHPFSGWEEELQDYYEETVETNQDWICDVSRPRSTWEDLRQERYQEMLDPFMENDDIRELLKRKSVSSFLSSGLRDSIDQLMMSRTQQPPKPLVSREREKERTDQSEGLEEAKVVEMKEGQNEFVQGQEEEEEEKRHSKSNGYGKDEEDEIPSEQECMESNDYAAEATSCDNNQDHYFVSASFTSSQESHTSSSPETQPSSSFANHPSMEMQFMHEMRGNMEQLHQEISELRRSITSCISMQMKLQKSIAQEAVSSSCHSGRKKRRDSSISKKYSRGRCSICYEMQIDSLLYRCGHMCTCFKCAQDLQWSSGKCPICQAPIIDVVRAYACS